MRLLHSVWPHCQVLNLVVFAIKGKFLARPAFLQNFDLFFKQLNPVGHIHAKGLEVSLLIT